MLSCFNISVKFTRLVSKTVLFVAKQLTAQLKWNTTWWDMKACSLTTVHCAAMVTQPTVFFRIISEENTPVKSLLSVINAQSGFLQMEHWHSTALSILFLTNYCHVQFVTKDSNAKPILTFICGHTLVRSHIHVQFAIAPFGSDLTAWNTYVLFMEKIHPNLIFGFTQICVFHFLKLCRWLTWN